MYSYKKNLDLDWITSSYRPHNFRLQTMLGMITFLQASFCGIINHFIMNYFWFKSKTSSNGAPHTYAQSSWFASNIVGIPHWSNHGRTSSGMYLISRVLSLFLLVASQTLDLSTRTKRTTLSFDSVATVSIFTKCGRGMACPASRDSTDFMLWLKPSKIKIAGGSFGGREPQGSTCSGMPLFLYLKLLRVGDLVSHIVTLSSTSSSRSQRKISRGGRTVHKTGYSLIRTFG
jgi:hypothetical protein